ncbi:hypothetical protein Aperf_G00000102148 [Anoplocephala perfoliata]
MESVGYVQQNDSSDFEYNQNNSGVEELNFDCQKPDYSIYGILNFLQSEWTKMSIERSRWEFERVELQAKITALQNEKNGCENLKSDLVRRVKMLECALQQERFKNFTLKYPNETQTDSFGKQDQESSLKTDELSATERARLREYLTRIGMSKLSNEMRALKVKELLGILVSNEEHASGESAEKAATEILDGGLTVREKLNEDANANDETANALAEFDRLVAQQGGGEVDVDFLADSFTADIVEPPRSWASGDQSAFVDRLKEQYRLGLPINRGQSQYTSKSTALPEEIPIPPHAYDEMELFASQGRRFQPPPSRTPEDLLLAAARAAVGAGTDVHDVASSTSGERGLGDLASLTSASALDNLDGVNQTQLLHATGGLVDDEADAAAAAKAALPSWTAKYTLRSHFDAIRSVVFHHADQILLTGSEDCTLRLWSLAKRVQAKKSSCLDVEPMFTCRGHTSPVLCVALLSVSPASSKEAEITSGRSSPLDTAALENNFAFSGALDGEIRSWRLGGLQFMLYETFDPSVAGPVLTGHSDAVWSIAVRADGTLLSASADGTVQVWNTLPTLLQSPPPQVASKCDSRVLTASRVFRPSANACPTSILFLPTDETACAVGLTSGDVCVLNLDTGRQIHFFDAGITKTADVTEHPGSVNALCVHPTLPLLFAAHENRQIRFLDTAQGVCLHNMIAHLEGVTSIAIDPRGSVLLSASHDASIRLWDVETRTCVQEFSSHRRKHDESIHSVVFHPTLPLIASAGADGLAKVYV